MIYAHLLHSSVFNRIISVRLDSNWKILQRLSQDFIYISWIEKKLIALERKGKVAYLWGWDVVFR